MFMMIKGLQQLFESLHQMEMIFFSSVCFSLVTLKESKVINSSQQTQTV